MKFKGIKKPLGNVEYIIPPLSLTSLEALQDRLASYTGGADKESIATVIDSLHAALKRNYPEITRADIGELVDLGNMQEIMECVMDVGGLLRKQAEATGDAPGEPLTGASSTPI